MTNISVLIVEDDKFLRELLVRKLENTGFNVSFAVNGEEALKKIKEQMPQLILLDLVLPGIDGFEVLKQVKANERMDGIAIIILSNLGQQGEVERGIRLGADDYLIKAHFTPDEIIQKAKMILEKKQG
ncbi:response regulator [Patescibacteria group bacterium]|nr:response regulator [Patescibacteria group bacterium]MBU4082575.1 response regulator [Patescibacteria group bacterium]MCG2809365.1 response regulator [Candidatus Portnoybacteria bacterium]